MIIGIDPGLLGAIAFYNGLNLYVYDIPTFAIERNGKAKRQINLQGLIEIIAKHHATHAYLENVNAMPGQGVSSMFQMGRGFGQIEMGLAAMDVPVTYVTPQVWKKALSVPKDKDGARQRASQLMPKHSNHWLLKKHDGRAEAALIAYYGWEKQK